MAVRKFTLPHGVSLGLEVFCSCGGAPSCGLVRFCGLYASAHLVTGCCDLVVLGIYLNLHLSAGVEPDDIVVLVLSWHFKAAAMYEYSREEFEEGK